MVASRGSARAIEPQRADRVLFQDEVVHLGLEARLTEALDPAVRCDQRLVRAEQQLRAQLRVAVLDELRGKPASILLCDLLRRARARRIASHWLEPLAGETRVHRRGAGDAETRAACCQFRGEAANEASLVLRWRDTRQTTRIFTTEWNREVDPNERVEGRGPRQGARGMKSLALPAGQSWRRLRRKTGGCPYPASVTPIRW